MTNEDEKLTPFVPVKPPPRPDRLLRAGKVVMLIGFITGPLITLVGFILVLIAFRKGQPGAKLTLMWGFVLLLAQSVFAWYVYQLYAGELLG